SETAAAFWGFGRTAALEFPDLWSGLLDLDPRDPPSIAASALTQLMAHTPGEDQLAWRSGQVWAARLKSDSPVVGSGSWKASREGTYLITGGTGALGLQLSNWLISRGARHLCLVSRRGIANDSAREAIARLRTGDAQVEVVACDLSNPASLKELLARLRSTGPLKGVVHAAGIDQHTPLDETPPEQVAAIVDPKLTAATGLNAETAEDPLDLFLLFSSISAVLGSPGRAVYGAANAGLDALASERSRRGQPALSIAWGPWAGGGMAAPDDLRALERYGQYPVDPAPALAAIDSLLAVGWPQATVVAIDWQRFVPLYEARKRRPIVSSLLHEVAPSASPKDHPAGAAQPPWVARLLAEPPQRRGELLRGLLLTEVTRILALPTPESFQVGKTLFDQGLDSLLTTELSRVLAKQLGIREPGLAFQHPWLDELSAELLKRVQLPGATAVQTSSKATAPPWRAELLALESSQRAGRLRELLRDTVANVLGLRSPTGLIEEQPFIEQGLDSLLAVQLANRLRSTLGTQDPTLVFQYPRLDVLTEHLLGTLEADAA
ncbi:MAG: beta-ketoacyl reductase, partial [Planctomycetaceae bacterium]